MAATEGQGHLQAAAGDGCSIAPLACYSRSLAVKTERSRSGTALKRAWDGASRAGTPVRTSLASRAPGARYSAESRPGTSRLR
jgi:hypothetical protein